MISPRRCIIILFYYHIFKACVIYLPDRVDLHLVHYFPVVVYEIIDRQTVLRVVRRAISRHGTTRYSDGSTHCKI